MRRVLFYFWQRTHGGIIVPIVVINSSFFRPHAGLSERLPRYGLAKNAKNPFALSQSDTTVIVDSPNAACDGGGRWE